MRVRDWGSQALDWLRPHWVDAAARARSRTMLSSCLVMATCGSLFTFASFAAGLKDRFAYSSANINLISSIGNSALYISFLAVGPFYDFFRVRATMFLGLVTYGLGYLLMYLAYAGTLDPTYCTAEWMATYYFVVGLGSTASYMAAIGVNLANYPNEHTGIVSGILLLFYGLSATIYSQIYFYYYSPSARGGLNDTGGFLLFLVYSVAALNLLGLLTMVHVPKAARSRSQLLMATEERVTAGAQDLARSTTSLPPKSPLPTWHSPPPHLAEEAAEERRKLLLLLNEPPQTVMSGAEAVDPAHSTKSTSSMAGQTMTSDAPSPGGPASPISVPAALATRDPPTATPTPSQVPGTGAAGTGGVITASPHSASPSSSTPASPYHSTARSEGMVARHSPYASGSISRSQRKPAGLPHRASVRSLRSMTSLASISLQPLEILKSPLFWFFAFAFVWQQGITYITNLSSILTSLHGREGSLADVAKDVSVHVTIISVFQSVGRFSFALLCDLVKRYSRWDRSYLLILAEVVLIIPCAILAAGTDVEGLLRSGLYVCSGLVGWGFGCGGALFPPLTKDFFGSAFYGTACGLVMLGVPAGIILSNLLYGNFYDEELRATTTPITWANGTITTSTACYGTSCYRKAFQLSTGIQLVPVLLSVCLFVYRSQMNRRRGKSISPGPPLLPVSTVAGVDGPGLQPPSIAAPASPASS